MKRIISPLALAMSLSFVPAAQAELIDRGGGLIYDDVLDITWLQDANYAKTSGYDAEGKMTWNQAKAWADNLSYGGFDDWRLPTMIDSGTIGCNYASSGTDCGWNVRARDAGTGTVYSELAYMYFVNLGLKSYYSASGIVQPDWGLFGNGMYGGQMIHNLQSHTYWFGLDYAPDTLGAWNFNIDNGLQAASYKADYYYAWAVRSGDVVALPDAAVLPEPATFALMLMGMGIAGWIARRRSRCPDHFSVKSELPRKRSTIVLPPPI